MRICVYNCVDWLIVLSFGLSHDTLDTILFEVKVTRQVLKYDLKSYKQTIILLNHVTCR